MCVCVCVCVCVRERERDRERLSVCVSVCVCWRYQHSSQLDKSIRCVTSLSRVNQNNSYCHALLKVVSIRVQRVFWAAILGVESEVIAAHQSPLSYFPHELNRSSPS